MKLIGDGGHARVVRSMLNGRFISDDYFIVAIGDNALRKQEAEWAESRAWKFGTLVDPSARVGTYFFGIGQGSVIMAGVIVQTNSCIGRHAIINTAATIDHDCIIGDYAHIAPGCHLCGNVTVGEGALLGVGTVVIPGIKIGAWAVVGAGSVVIRDVPDGAKVAGNPARAI